MDKSRIDHLRRRVKEAKKEKERTHTVRWRDKNIYLPVIRVETSFLHYRLKSGRTRRKQMEYLEKTPHISPDLFSDPESGEAQTAQHEILLKMVDQAGLREDLLKEGQRQPAIITYDGYVLNGNRRLAVLKDNNIPWMDCAVLPEDATLTDLYDLELDLQMAKETKAPYNWVDALLHLRYGVETLKRDASILAKKMRISKQELTHKTNMLHLVDLYLEWLGKTGQHHILGEKDEQVFIELEKFTKKLDDLEKQKIAREIVFGVLKNPPPTGRLYGHVRKIFRNFDETLRNFRNRKEEDAEDLDTSIEVEKKEEKTPETALSDDPLKGLAAEGIVEEDVLTQVSPYFSKPETAEKNIEILIEASEDADAIAKEKKDRKASYRAVSEAQRTLQGIQINSTTSEVKAIYRKLQEIIQLAEEIMINIDKHREKKDEN